MNKYLIGGVAILVIVAGWILLGNNAGTKVQTSPSASPVASPSTSPSAMEERKITVNKNGFEPQSLKIKIGTKVTWDNKSGVMVNVSSDPHPIHTLWPFLNLGNFDDGASVSATFDKAGTYTYHNHLNPSQTGTVVVE